MLTTTRRRLGSPAWLAAGLVLLLPALAEAQLFPNRTIRRERPPCSTESPFNAQVRRDYFGYYPTCWTKFPEGWRCPCPNPELPDFEKSKREFPIDAYRKPAGTNSLDIDSEDDRFSRPMDDRPGGARPNDLPDPNVPLPNPNRSPFELDPNRNPNPNPNPNATPPGNNPPRPGDPFGDPAPNPPRPNTPPGSSSSRTPAARGASASSLMELPDLPETSPAPGLVGAATVPGPGSMTIVPEASLASTADTDRPDLGPLPSAPMPASSNPGPVTIPDPSESDQILGRPTPAQAPRRRSLLGALFNRGDSRNR